MLKASPSNVFGLGENFEEYDVDYSTSGNSYTCKKTTKQIVIFHVENAFDKVYTLLNEFYTHIGIVLCSSFFPHFSRFCREKMVSSCELAVFQAREA